MVLVRAASTKPTNYYLTHSFFDSGNLMSIILILGKYTTRPAQKLGLIIRSQLKVPSVPIKKRGTRH